MYPDFQYLLQQVFHTNIPDWVSIFKVFGFMMAVAFMGALITLTLELKRKQKEGLLHAELDTVKVKNKQTGKMETKTALVYPHERVSTLLALAGIGGIIGAKIFNAFESWEYFIQDPIGNLFSRSGLTFYGGLITATVLIFFYARKHKIAFDVLCDAVAPGLMLAYGVGRLGCHFAGDGDWGIFNSAYVTDAYGTLKAASPADYQNALHHASGFLMQYAHISSPAELAQIPHAYMPAPSWLPDWLYGMNYAHNVNSEGVPIAGCVGNYCTVMPISVFPTSLYEAVVCILLFCLLWSVRKRFAQPLKLFGFYLILNGLERFFIEKIRVNYKYDWGFIHPTQAEIISTCLVLSGIAILLFYKRKSAGNTPAPLNV